MALKAVTSGIHALAVGPVNLFLIEDGRDLVLIDAALPGNEGAVLAAVSELGRMPSDLKHIVLTHAHPDHIGSAAALKKVTNANIWMHALDVPIAEGRIPFRPITSSPDPLNRAMHFLMSHSTQVTVDPVTIDNQVGDGDILPIADGLTTIHVPGHCAGEIALLMKTRGILFVGDACANLFWLGAPLGYEDIKSGRQPA